MARIKGSLFWYLPCVEIEGVCRECVGMWRKCGRSVLGVTWHEVACIGMCWECVGMWKKCAWSVLGVSRI